MATIQPTLVWVLLWPYLRIYHALDCSSNCTSKAKVFEGKLMLTILYEFPSRIICAITCSTSDIQQVGNISLVGTGISNYTFAFERDESTMFTVNLNFNAMEIFLQSLMETVWFQIRDDKSYLGSVKVILPRRIYKGVFDNSLNICSNATWRIRSSLISEVTFKMTPYLIMGTLPICLEILDYPAGSATFLLLESDGSASLNGDIKEVVFASQGLLVLKDGFLYLSTSENPLILRRKNFEKAVAHLLHFAYLSRGIIMEKSALIAVDGRLITDITTKFESFPVLVDTESAQLLVDILRSTILVFDINLLSQRLPATLSVYRWDGTAFCRFSFAKTSTRITKVWLHQKTGRIYAFGNEVWLSRDGGCIFERLIYGSKNESFQVVGSQLTGNIIVMESVRSGYFFSDERRVWYRLETQPFKNCSGQNHVFVDDFGIPIRDCCINISTCFSYAMRVVDLDMISSLVILSMTYEKPREIKLTLSNHHPLSALYSTSLCSKIFRFGVTSCTYSKGAVHVNYKVLAETLKLRSAYLDFKESNTDCIGSNLSFRDDNYPFHPDAMHGSRCVAGIRIEKESMDSPTDVRYVLNLSGRVQAKPLQLIWVKSFFGYILDVQDDHLLTVRSLLGILPEQGNISALISNVTLPQVVFQQPENCVQSTKILRIYQEFIEIDALDVIRIPVAQTYLSCQVPRLPNPWIALPIRIEVIQSLPGNFRVVHQQIGGIHTELAITHKNPRWKDTIASIVVAPKYSCPTCNTEHQVLTASSTCPEAKHLVARFPTDFDEHSFIYGHPTDNSGVLRVYDLPVNYRPPSWQGKAIPNSPNVYNADPASQMLHKPFGDGVQPAFKQCLGKRSRVECACENWMTASNRVEYSDCIFRAYRLVYPEIFRPTLYVRRNNLKDVEFKTPLQLDEVNKRQDFSIHNSGKTALDHLPHESANLFASGNSTIILSGSGLYHFRFKVTQSGLSFCNMSAETIVFVDEVPMAYPTQDLVRSATAFIFGAVLFVLFIFKWFKPVRE